jgi:hypothetical protein
MHDFTARQFHDHRMGELTREADAYRLAANAKEGRTRRDARLHWPRWLSFGPFRLHSKPGDLREPRTRVAHP